MTKIDPTEPSPEEKRELAKGSGNAEADLDDFLAFFQEYQQDPSKPPPLWELVQALDSEDHIGFGGMTVRSYRMVAAYCRRLEAELLA